ncbi:hypothetical protein HYV80_02610 [Candidatus Woesearchaeota archaeon]|nr:hypothetical protein [Candidatus Woesearchaeota archaeon]
MPTASELEKGSYFIVNGEPVRVTRKEVVAFGTHSHSKLKIFYQPLSGGGEKSITLQHADKVDVVEIIRKLGQVISKTGGKAQIMDMVSYETLDASAASDIFNSLNEGDQVTFIDLKGDVKIIEKR